MKQAVSCGEMRDDARQIPSRSGKAPRGMAFLALSQLLALGITLPAVQSQAAGTSPVDPSKAASQRNERRVSLDFVQADVNDVAKALSVQSGVNVVLMPSVKGNITVRLINVTPEEALKKMASAVAADVRKSDSTFFLGSTAELRALAAQNGARTTLSLKWASAEDLKMVVQSAWPYLTVEAAPKANVLVLAGAEEDVLAAVKRIQEADTEPPAPKKPEPVVEPTMRDAVAVKFGKPEVLAEAIQKACPTVKVSAVERTLIFEGPKEAQAQAVKILAALDTQGAAERVVRAYSLKYLHPNQAVLPIKAHFPDLTVSAGFDSYSPSKAVFTPLGLDTASSFSQQGLNGGQSQQQGGGAAGGVDVSGPGSRSRVLILAGPKEQVEQATQVLAAQDIAPVQVLIEAKMVEMSPESSKQLGFLYDWNSFSFTENNGRNKAHQFGGWSRAPFNWNVTLEAMETRREAKVLARPNIAVVDGEDASIFIGDILRYERLQSNTAAGQAFTIESVPVGVALLCRPRVNGEGDVTLRVHPVVSTVSGFTGRNKDIPITSSREAESVIRMKDGETVAIGGLLREEDIRTLTKVPILGDLPLLGQLFRHRNNSQRKTEVTIFITVKMMKP